MSFGKMVVLNNKKTLSMLTVHNYSAYIVRPYFVYLSHIAFFN